MDWAAILIVGLFESEDHLVRQRAQKALEAALVQSDSSALTDYFAKNSADAEVRRRCRMAAAAYRSVELPEGLRVDHFPGGSHFLSERGYPALNPQDYVDHLFERGYPRSRVLSVVKAAKKNLDKERGQW